MVKKLLYKYYNKRITTCDNDNVLAHDQEESKLNRIKYGFVELVVIRFTFNTRFDYVIPSDFIH